MRPGALLFPPIARGFRREKLCPWIVAHPTPMIVQCNPQIGSLTPTDVRDLRPVALRNDCACRDYRAAVVRQPSKRSPLRNAGMRTAPAHDAASVGAGIGHPAYMALRWEPVWTIGL